MPTENRSNGTEPVSDSEMTECQFHNNCGGWCETPRELEHNLCEHCLEAHDEEMAQPSERHHGELTLNDAIARALTGTEWGGDRKRIAELLAPLLQVQHESDPVAEVVMVDPFVLTTGNLHKLKVGDRLYTHPAPEVQKRYASRASSEKHDGTTLAVLTLGAFDSTELGDIDIQVRMDNAESLQQKLVSTEDVAVDLVSAEWARGLEQEVEDCWGTIDKMHMQALGADDRAKEIADLRAQLAERDALLQGWMNIPRAASSPELNDLCRKTDYLLSASAAPEVQL